MRFAAVIFDFNGTLLQDDVENQQSWLQFLYAHLKQHIPDSEYRDNIQGRSNFSVLKEYISEDLAKAELEELSEGKERLYRRMLVDRGDGLKLTDGAYNLFDYLDYQRIPYTIATGAPPLNVDFYFEIFELERWFDRGDILVDTGEFPGKPDPEIYLRAMKQLGSTPENTLVVEDSMMGILAAERAGIKHIILIDATKNKERKYPVFDNFDEIIQYILDLEKKD